MTTTDFETTGSSINLWLRDITGGEFISEKPTTGTAPSEVSELTERVETLVNQVGQFYTQTVERPIKWVTQIRDLGDESYTLVEPVLILVEEYLDGDTVIARFPEIGAFGEGATDTEAILNLKNSMLDLYDELTECDPDRLGQLPKMWLRVLEKLIIRN